MNNIILADGRWKGSHGIGRFSHEVLSRLTRTDMLNTGPAPLSLQNLVWQPYYLRQHKNQYRVFFNPGYNPALFSAIPFVFTIHDLIHLFVPGKAAVLKKLYYEYFMKPAARSAAKVLTVSEYSKKNIIEWANIDADNIVVVGNGISSCFTAHGERHQPGYPYLLHVGNTKAHKNVVRLLESFALAKIDNAFHLILTGELTPELEVIIKKYRLEERVIFCGSLTDEKLAAYYRGATAFILPSLYEGFGIPLIEAMASGIPTIAANVTSLPEIAGDAALLIDPTSTAELTHAIEKIIIDDAIRKELVVKGFERVKLFSWDKTAAKVQSVLDDVVSTF